MGCTATSWSSRLVPTTGPRSTARCVLTLDDILLDEGQVAPLQPQWDEYSAMGRFGDVLVASGETDATGAENPAIDWRLRVGDRVKIRLVNEMPGDHPMHHPFHVHVAGRFLVLSRDGVIEPNLVRKDTVLVRTGETVDILLDVPIPVTGSPTPTSPSTMRAA